MKLKQNIKGFFFIILALFFCSITGYAVDFSNCSITAEIDSGQENSWTIKMHGLNDENVKTVQFPVWSQENGQDDLYWYEGTKDIDGLWSANVNMNNHLIPGIYDIHAYVIMTDGSKRFIGQTTFEVTEPSMDVSVENYQKDEGTFDVVIRNVIASSGVDKIQVPVWCAEGQKDLVWHTAEKQEDGSYKATISIAQHDYLVGDYNIHVYLYAKNGVLKTYVAPNLNVQLPAVDISAKDQAGTETTYDLMISNADALGNFKDVRFAVWSEKDGQDDLMWYKGREGEKDTWTATADIANNHKTAGIYQLHAYVLTINGNQSFIGKITFEVAEPSMEVSVENYEEEEGTFDVVISNVNAPSGVDKIQVPVWCAEKQKDLIWHTAEKQEDGSYKATISIAQHDYLVGDYNIHVYLYAKNGVLKTYVAENLSVSLPEVNLNAEDKSGTELNYSLSAENESVLKNAEGVQFAVWSEKDGQDDLVWYGGREGEKGSWTATADIAKKHKTAGTYQLHVYAVTVGGSKSFMGKTTFEVTEPSMDVSVENYQKDEGTFDVVIRNAKAPSGVDKIQVPVWCAEKQKDLVWHTAEKQEDGSYKATISIAQHGYLVGDYNIHVYMYTKNGVLKTYVAHQLNVLFPNIDINAEDASGMEMFYDLKAANLEILGKIEEVRFAVWSEKDGQDDLAWYGGIKETKDSWTATANIEKNHKAAGIYQVHVYVSLTNEPNKFIGKIIFEVSMIKAEVRIENVEKDKGTFEIVIDKIDSPSGVKIVRIPVWCEDNQSDLVWYNCVKQEDGSYRTKVDIENHNYMVGMYKIHVYITGGNSGVTTLVADNFMFESEAKLINGGKMVCTGDKLGEKNILFIGNSITLHPLKSYWWGERGMASTSIENDYVHQVVKRLAYSFDVEYSAFNFSVWEKTTDNRVNMLEQLDSLLKVQYDYIIVQLGENVTELNGFERDLEELIEYIDEKQTSAHIILVGNFWENDELDQTKIEICDERNLKYVDLKDLQTNDYQAGIGTVVVGYDDKEFKIDNRFVAIHPGDAGMQAIAEKIYKALY